MEFGIDLHIGANGDVQGIQLDVRVLMERLQAAFPKIAFEEEYYARQLHEMRQRLSGHPGAESALAQAQRDAEERGPRFGFAILDNGEQVLTGGVSRHCLSFRTSDRTPIELIAEVESFLGTFVLRRFGESQQAPRG